MRDFIAYQMSDDDWKEICREYLEDESENRVIKENPKNVYDQAYSVICLLIIKQIVCNWSDMEKVLNNLNNKVIVKKFTQKFNEALEQGQ